MPKIMFEEFEAQSREVGDRLALLTLESKIHQSVFVHFTLEELVSFFLMDLMDETKKIIFKHIQRRPSEEFKKIMANQSKKDAFERNLFKVLAKKSKDYLRQLYDKEESKPEVKSISFKAFVYRASENTNYIFKLAKRVA